MRAQTRHQLKQDRFVDAAGETAQWAVQHRNKLITTAAIVAIVAAAALGSWYYEQNQDASASAELGKAMSTYTAPLRPAGTPADPQYVSFTSSQERAKAAQQQFQGVADKYRRTHSGEIARYFVGLTAIDLGDNTAAEKNLKQVADSRNHDIASLAKLGLATVYHETNRDPQAIEIYKELIAKPTTAVSKARAQLELASLYQAKDPPEARKLLEQVSKDNPNTPASQIANMRMQQIK